MCEMVRMMLAISFAAVMHRTLLSELTEAASLFLSALKMAAWCRQTVDVWILMLVKMTLGFDKPAGSFRCEGSPSDVLRRMLSICRCRFQKGPLRSWSWSSSSGRWRWTRLRPNKLAKRTTPPKDDSLPTPDGPVHSISVGVCSGRLISKASSDDGIFVMMSLSSIVIGQPVPMLA